jgi:hypothetical protein
MRAKKKRARPRTVVEKCNIQGQHLPLEHADMQAIIWTWRWFAKLEPHKFPVFPYWDESDTKLMFLYIL